MKRIRYSERSAAKVIRQFNAEVPVGTVVEADLPGRGSIRAKTWCPAARDLHDGNAVVWLEGIDELVPLGRITVFVEA